MMNYSFILFFAIIINYSSIYSNEKEEIFKPVKIELLKMKVDSAFIDKIINDSRTDFNDKYCKINVTGFLNKPDYSKHYNEYSVTKTATFYNEHVEKLIEAETKFNVSAYAIAAVLWVETRHGAYTGNHHVASIYLSLALTNQPDFLAKNIKNLENNFEGDKKELEKLKQKIIARSEKKSKWALDQLKALYQMSIITEFDVLDIKGSWAGAFGYSQFLPSSYMSWAVDGNDDDSIDLFNMDDAIFSVANYLNINGWGKSDEAKRKAVFHYNNSTDYVNAVLKLTELIEQEIKASSKN